MAINFASARPGIDLFNANVARGDAQRSQEEHDFERRLQMEREQEKYRQAQGADLGMRNAIAAYYAQQRAPVQPVPTTSFQPTPAAPPPAAVAAPSSAAQPPGVAPPFSPDPYRYSVGGKVIPNAQSFGEAPRLPNADQILAAPLAGTEPSPAASTTPPAAAPVPAQPAPGARAGGSSFAPVMSELAKQPGTGQAMMSMFSTDLQTQRAASGEERKMQMQALKEFGDAAAKGQFQIAAAINQKFRLGMPEEMVRNPGFMSKLGGWMGAWKDKMTPEQNMAGAQAYLEGLSNNLDENTAIKAGIQAARAVKPEFQATHFDHSPSGEVMAFDKSGAVKRTGAMARQPANASGGAGGMSKQQQFTDYKIKLYTERLHLDDETAVKLATNPRMLVTPQDIMRVENNLRRMTNMGRPLYKTEAEVRAAARSSITAAQRDAGGGAGAPTAGTEGAATAGPANDPLGIRAR